MATVIAKLYANGNFETVGAQLVQGGNAYSFTENTITVPTIVEYPPVGYRNYFIEKTSVPGYTLNRIEGDLQPGDVAPPNEFDRTSDFIAVNDWGSATVRIRFSNIDYYGAWVAIALYDNDKVYIESRFREAVGPTEGYYLFELKFSTDTGFMRVTANHYDTPEKNVKISVEKGDTTNSKHYLAFEDMPEWVVDTGQPISIFKEGIVIKGDLITT